MKRINRKIYKKSKKIKLNYLIETEQYFGRDTVIQLYNIY